MGTRSWKFVAANESTVLAKQLFDVIVVEDGERNGCLPDPSPVGFSASSMTFLSAHCVKNRSSAQGEAIHQVVHYENVGLRAS